MRITDYLKKECISISESGKNKNEVIRKQADLLMLGYFDINKDEALEGLFEREKIETTGVGEGVAIPHASIESCKEIQVALSILSKGVDFNSLDNLPVRIVFLILFPKGKVNLQLRFLAGVSRILRYNGMKESLLECDSPDNILDVLKRYEEMHF